jgi:hypothetical protein
VFSALMDTGASSVVQNGSLTWSDSTDGPP